RPTHARNTVEYAHFIAPDMLLITGTFEPDVGAIKVPFVQMRVNHNGQWLMNDLTIFILPAEKAHASPATGTNKKIARPAAAAPPGGTAVALRMFRGLDADKDGKLSEAELIEGIEAWFNRTDSHHDHALTRGEVQAAVVRHHRHVARTAGPRKG